MGAHCHPPQPFHSQSSLLNFWTVCLSTAFSTQDYNIKLAVLLIFLVHLLLFPTIPRNIHFFFMSHSDLSPSSPDSKASGFSMLPCPGRITMPMERVGVGGWDESIPRLKGRNLPLFLSKAQLFMVNKCLSNCYMPLMNFQTPKMLILEDSVHFYYQFLEVRMVKLFTMLFFSLTFSVH